MLVKAKKSSYKTGARSRDLVLQRLTAYGQPADVPKLAELTGMVRSHVRYTVRVMLPLGMLYLHHWEKNKSNRAKAFYFTEPSNRKIIVTYE